MNPSQSYDRDLHDDDSPAAQGLCSHHPPRDSECTGEAVVSYQDSAGAWQAGCSRALEQLVERGEIEPLGQGA
jgi:hypothetical protein